MSLRIVRNDITKMTTQAIVNTANDYPTVGTGCDHAVYTAAGYDELLSYRTEKIGFVPEGDAFITPGFNLPAEYIIHAVSPLYIDGTQGEEEKLRSCYRRSLQLAKEYEIHSIAFPLIATGGFGYPKEEGLRIAIDEINAFLFGNEMEVYLVLFDKITTKLGERIYPDLEKYIDENYVEGRSGEEYGDNIVFTDSTGGSAFTGYLSHEQLIERRKRWEAEEREKAEKLPPHSSSDPYTGVDTDFDFSEQHGDRLEERIKHGSDSFSEYLLYLIERKGMKNSDVYRRALVDRKVFSKIKNNPDYHPQKETALCLCVGAKLNLDESKDLLARAGYALSSYDKMDIIFAYFIENGIYDMIELDIQLEEHGLPCMIA